MKSARLLFGFLLFVSLFLVCFFFECHTSIVFLRNDFCINGCAQNSQNAEFVAACEGQIGTKHVSDTCMATNDHYSQKKEIVKTKLYLLNQQKYYSYELLTGCDLPPTPILACMSEKEYDADGEWVIDAGNVNTTIDCSNGYKKSRMSTRQYKEILAIEDENGVFEDWYYDEDGKTVEITHNECLNRKDTRETSCGTKGSTEPPSC